MFGQIKHLMVPSCSVNQNAAWTGWLKDARESKHAAQIFCLRKGASFIIFKDNFFFTTKCSVLIYRCLHSFLIFRQPSCEETPVFCYSKKYFDVLVFGCKTEPAKFLQPSCTQEKGSRCPLHWSISHNQQVIWFSLKPSQTKISRWLNLSPF